MPPEQDTPENLVDGGTPTDEEARLAAQLPTIGDDPQEEPADPAAAPAGDDAAAAASAAGDGTADAAAAPAEGATDAGADAAAAAAAATDPAAPAAATQPEPPVAAPPPKPPEPPRDFDAAYAANQKKFDDGEIDADEFQKELRTITKEEAGYLARVEIFNERQQTAAQAAAQAFNTAALAWENNHKEFMANPLYADAMRRATIEIDKQTGGALSPEELLARAEKAAFEFTKYTPPAATKPEDDAAKKREAIAAAAAARKPAPVPTTLGGTPTAAHIDATSGNSAFENLDRMDIDNLENALAHMTPEQQEAYLADAPGAKTTGR